MGRVLFLICLLGIAAASIPLPDIWGFGTPCHVHIKEDSCIMYCACVWEEASSTCVGRTDVEGEAVTLTSCDHNTLVIAGYVAAVLTVLCLCFCCFCCNFLICVSCIMSYFNRRRIRRRLQEFEMHPLRTKHRSNEKKSKEELFAKRNGYRRSE